MMYRGGNQGVRWSKNKAFRFFAELGKKKQTILLISIFIAIIALFLIIAITMPNDNQKQARNETYKKISGGAGLKATINYEAHCKKQPCKPTYDFNVYFLNQDGRQVAVVQPDKSGNVHAALPEGDYILLIGKRFGTDGIFPQEPVALKNGQELELKLHYKEEAL